MSSHQPHMEIQTCDLFFSFSVMHSWKIYIDFHLEKKNSRCWISRFSKSQFIEEVQEKAQRGKSKKQNPFPFFHTLLLHTHLLLYKKCALTWCLKWALANDLGCCLTMKEECKTVNKRVVLVWELFWIQPWSWMLNKFVLFSHVPLQRNWI